MGRHAPPRGRCPRRRPSASARRSRRRSSGSRARHRARCTRCTRRPRPRRGVPARARTGRTPALTEPEPHAAPRSPRPRRLAQQRACRAAAEWVGSSVRTFGGVTRADGGPDRGRTRSGTAQEAAPATEEHAQDLWPMVAALTAQIIRRCQSCSTSCRSDIKRPLPGWLAGGWPATTAASRWT